MTIMPIYTSKKFGRGITIPRGTTQMQKSCRVRAGWALFAAFIWLTTSVPNHVMAQRQPVEGSVNETVAGPAGKRSATVTGNRSVERNTATNQGTITGSGGKSVTATGSSEVHGNTVTGQGTVTGPSGQTTRLSG